MHEPSGTPPQANKTNQMALLERFYLDHHSDLLVFCYRRLGDMDQARDASARIMLKAVRSLDSFTPHPENPGATMRAWLYRIARNDLIDTRRTARVEHSLDALHADGNPIHNPPDQRAGPEEAALLGESEQDVQRMLAHLPDSQRTIVELRLAGLRGDEIAEALGLTLSAVKSAQFRAYQRLRELYFSHQQDVP